MYSMTWPPLALVSPISRTGGPPIDSRRGGSASDEVADQAIDQGRLLVDEPVRAVGDATDREVRNVTRQPVEIAGQERRVLLAPQDEGGHPDRRVAGELADRRPARGAVAGGRPDPRGPVVVEPARERPRLGPGLEVGPPVGRGKGAPGEEGGEHRLLETGEPVRGEERLGGGGAEPEHILACLLLRRVLPELARVHGRAL